MSSFRPESFVLSTRKVDQTALVHNAAALAASERLEEALALLSQDHGSSPEVRNARAVCLMRLGRFEAALQVLRSLVLQSGSTWMKSDLPIIYRTNFTTALLLANVPNGVRDALFEIANADHPSVIRLRNALATWQQSLSWWQRLNWKMGFAPSVPIKIDFAPGDFVDPLTQVATAVPKAVPSVSPVGVIAHHAV